MSYTHVKQTRRACKSTQCKEKNTRTCIHKRGGEEKGRGGGGRQNAEAKVQGTKAKEGTTI